MLLRLLHKEMLSHVLSLRFAVAFVIVCVVVIGSFYLTNIEYRGWSAEYAARQRRYGDRTREIFKEQWPNTRAWRLFRDEGTGHAVLDPPMAAVAQGLTPALPAAIGVTRGGWTNVDRNASRNPLLGLYQAPDFVYVVGIVMSLLAVLFMFDAVCGEKEAGTLRLMLASGVARHEVLLSKWLAGCVVLWAPFLVATGAGVGYIWASGTLNMTGDHVIRLGLLILAALSYIALFVTFGLFVSTSVPRPVTALFIGLFVWVVWVMVLPNMTPMIAKLIAPTPSARKIAAEKQAVDDELDMQTQRLEIAMTGDDFNVQMENLAHQREQRKAQWDRFLEQAEQSQNRWSQGLARISPLGSWVYASTGAAQTGPDAYQRFEQARQRLVQVTRTIDQQYWQTWESTGEPPSLSPEDLPKLDITLPGVDETIDASLQDLLIVAIWTAAFFLASFVLFLRYDVR